MDELFLMEIQVLLHRQIGSLVAEQLIVQLEQ
jgi:hypothetical protein